MTSLTQMAIAQHNAEVNARNNARTPGPKTPSKYPVAVGPNYNHYGEQPGYIYNPYTDHYIPDPKVAGQYTGQPEAPTPPGLGQVIGVPAAVLGAGALATEGTKGLVNGGLFSLGGKAGASEAAKVAATTTNPAVSDAAYAAASNAGVSGIGPIASGDAYAGELGATAAPESAGLLGIGALPVAAIAAGTYLGGKSAYDMFQGKTDNSIPGMIGRGTLGIATGGISEIARHFLMHQSTKDVQQEEADKLAGRSGDPNWQTAVSAIQNSVANGPADPSKPFSDTKGNSYSTFDQYKQAGLDPENMRLQPGVLDTFGPDYTNLTPDKQRQITQGLIDAGLLGNEKGRVVVTDPSKAQAIYNQYVNPQQPAPQGQPQQSGQGLMSPSVSGAPQNTQNLGIDNTPLDQMKPPTGNIDSGFTVTIPAGVDPVDWIKQQQGSGNIPATEKAPQPTAPKQVRVKGSNGLYYWKQA